MSVTINQKMTFGEYIGAVEAINTSSISIHKLQITCSSMLNVKYKKSLLSNFDSYKRK